MRIRAERDDLADVLTRAGRAVGTRSPLPILQGILCEVSGGRLQVTGTDNEVTVRDRDTMDQDRISIGKLIEYLTERLPS